MASLDTLPEVPGRVAFRGHLPALQKNRLGVFDSAMETGPLTRLSYFTRHFLVVSTPELASELLVDHGKHTRKTPGLRLLLGRIGGEGLFTSEGEHWRKQRRVMAPLFQPANIGRYAEVMTGTALDTARAWKDGERVNLLHEMTKVTMNVVGRTLFGAEAFHDADDLGRCITVMLEWVNRSISSPGLVLNVIGLELAERVSPRLQASARFQKLTRTPLVLPGVRAPELNEAHRLLDERLGALIAERRAHPLQRDDLLSRLLGAKDEDGSVMSDEQLRDEAATLFIAGHETTANALAWTLALWARHPEWQAHAQAEVDALQGKAPTFEDVMRMPTVVRSFKEAMRLYPPLTVLVRQATEPFTLGGYDVPKGQLMFLPVWSLHRNPAVWPRPLEFDPNRFAPEQEKARHRAAWLPFGLGGRVCIGSHFAMLEGPLVLAALLQTTRLEVDATQPLEREEVATLRPKNGVWATVHKRS